MKTCLSYLYFNSVVSFRKVVVVPNQLHIQKHVVQKRFDTCSAWRPRGFVGFAKHAEPR